MDTLPFRFKLFLQLFQEKQLLKKPELLSPAGSLDAAICAFKAGADAVYLGLKDFSARKSAKNFSEEELLKLISYARPLNKKIFVTLNTLIKESEFYEALETAAFLNRIEIDAVILQDTGFSFALKTLFPNLKLHASTQMAAHSPEGVETLKNCGFSRVVLSRELSLEKIIEIKKSSPDIELEVFIHGAMCYSFSGLCLASGILLGRSGNRGECAQICRNYYEIDNENKYCFSCNDMCLEEKVTALWKAGIDSFKIEGRMKSPSFVYHTTDLYRSIIDRKDHIKSYKLSTISFARMQTTGYFKSLTGENSVNSNYPGHRGLLTGICRKTIDGWFLIKTREKISIRDGILFFKKNDESRSYSFSVKEIKTLSGKKINYAKPGEEVFIKTDKTPEAGDKIYLTSSTETQINCSFDQTFSLWKKNINIDVSISKNCLMIKSGDYKLTKNLHFEKSDNENGFIKKFEKIFHSSGNCIYRTGKINFDKTCCYIFIQPLILKEVRNLFYQSYLEHIKEKERKKIRKYLETPFKYEESVPEIFSKRELFTPDPKIPFILENDNLENLSVVGKHTLIPLIPVMKKSSLYLEKIVNFIVSHPERMFLVGISNIGHLSLANKLKSCKNVSYFLDFHTYTTNTSTYHFYKEHLKNKLLFGYQWIEISDIINCNEIIKCSPKFNPPLFISHACFEKANNYKQCEKCDKSMVKRKVSNNRQAFEVVTIDCISFLYKNSDN
jgi:U32 family peptidase